MFARSLVPLVLALACAAHPLLHVTRNQNAITIPLAKHFNFTGSTKIAARDRARARALLTGAQGHVAARDTVDGAALSNVLVSYIATVRSYVATFSVGYITSKSSIRCQLEVKLPLVRPKIPPSPLHDLYTTIRRLNCGHRKRQYLGWSWKTVCVFQHNETNGKEYGACPIT